MGSFSIFHWLIVLAVILILFGAGKLPNVAGDMAKAIKAFRAGLKDEDDKGVAAPPSVAPPAAAPAPLGHVQAAPAADARPTGQGPSAAS